MKIIFDNLLNNFLPCDAYWKYIEILNNKKRGRITDIEKKLKTILLMYSCFTVVLFSSVQQVHFAIQQKIAQYCKATKPWFSEEVGGKVIQQLGSGSKLLDVRYTQGSVVQHGK